MPNLFPHPLEYDEQTFIQKIPGQTRNNVFSFFVFQKRLPKKRFITIKWFKSGTTT